MREEIEKEKIKIKREEKEEKSIEADKEIEIRGFSKGEILREKYPLV